MRTLTRPLRAQNCALMWHAANPGKHDPAELSYKMPTNEIASFARDFAMGNHALARLQMTVRAASSTDLSPQPYP